MKAVKLVDIAPTMTSILGLQQWTAIDGKPIFEVAGWKCKRVALLIVDSLGYQLYRAIEFDLPHMRALARTGFLFGAESVSRSTTPSIASILTGLLPQNHGVYNTGEASESKIRSLVEWASFQGISTAVVMEAAGASAFRGFVKVVYEIPGSLSAQEFDQEVRDKSLEALGMGCEVLVAHFIGIDRVTHQDGGWDDIKKAAISIDEHVGSIFHASPDDTFIVICGDHPIHAGKFKDVFDSKYVALILGNKASKAD